VQRVGAQLLPIDWGAISPLRLRAAEVAAGAYSGLHHSRKRGAGVEFEGQRPYVPGDDLRFIDRRSLLRHQRLMVREFETEHERAVWLCVDSSASMSYRGRRAPGAKLAYAALIAAAMARVAVSSGDPVGLTWLGEGAEGLRGARFGLGAFERLVSRLEAAVAAGDLLRDAERLDDALRLLAGRVGRGQALVVLSDLLDLPEAAARGVAALASRRRALVVVQVLDPDERDLAFSGKVRLRSIEGKVRVVTDADMVRGEYRRRLAAHTASWRRAIEGEGGRLVSACSDDEPVGVVRSVLRALGEARR